MDNPPTHLDLFSGIGGFALAAQWAGLETIGFCEIDPWCRRVLGKHWPEVPIHDDVRRLSAGVIRDWLGGRELDIITGGYPCQPFSLAGQRKGEHDERHLWPEIARILRAIRPRWCLFENVAGHVSMGLDDVLTELESIGYQAGAAIVPACAVNAPHRRDRVWIVAHARGGDGYGRPNDSTGNHTYGQDTGRPQGTSGANQCGEALAHAEGRGIRCGLTPGQTGQPTCGSETLADASCELPHRGGIPRRWRPESPNGGGRQAQCGMGNEDDGLPRWVVRPRGVKGLDPRWGGNPLGAFGPHWEDGVPRLTEGEKHRVHKLKALGNAIVPQVAYVILSAMLASESAATEEVAA